MKVKELSKHLINKIAAGEVIERPASVVKELVENSIDAASTQIDVSIDEGGIRYITVIDNGEGMTKEDLLLAIRRHTTSKIFKEADLENIKTLGFRGEALASIVEVSKAVIISRGEEEATRVEVEGGKVKKIQTAGRQRGTTVDVHDLFFNTPARRKYLRHPKTEGFHIIKVMKRFILSCPQIHFRLFRKGKKIIDSPETKDLREVIAHLWGVELAKSLIEISFKSNLIEVRGLVGGPDVVRANREQLVFVNGRYVYDSRINYAVAKAYEGALKIKEKYPVVFLFLEVESQMVDVNVHPRKEEVRFSNPTLVQSAVKRAIDSALISHHVVPQLDIKQKHLKEVELDLKKFKPKHEREGVETKEIEIKTKTKPPETYRIIGQLHGAYIIVQTEEGFELVDQHAAEERILYEQLLEQINSTIKRQKLLIPLTLRLPPDKAAILEENLGLLDRKLGIGLESFGSGTFILREWPQVLPISKEAFKTSIERLIEVLEKGGEIEVELLTRELVAQRACGRAVEVRVLDQEEMKSLIYRLRQTKNPYTCPHGRPIIVRYSLENLEHSFKRG